MSKSHRAFALIFLMIFIASATIPIAFNNQAVTTVSLVEAPHTPSATNYVVTISVSNELQEFNDDDFKFTVLNGSTPLDNAWVRLFNASTMILLQNDFTDGNGEVDFFNLAQGTYQWNVSHASDPTTHDEIGQIVSDGPEAYVNTLFGNLDWENDEDDLNTTITDIKAELANNLNFSIHFSANDSIWAQVEVIDGRADFEDIPDGDYIWKLSVLDDIFYGGYLLDSGILEANSTQKLVLQSLGPLTGNSDYYDVEIFTYFETSFQPIAGVLINMTYKNGTVYEIQTTPINGTVIFVDIPIAYMNWTITYGGLPIGLGDYSYNFSSASCDIRAPIITGPGNQNILFDAENVTITWHLEDEFPETIEVFIDGVLNISIAWVNTTYDYIFNISAALNEFIIGEYEVKLVVYDQNLNFAENITILTIYEDVFPELEGPEDVEFYFTETGYSLSWNVSDDYLNKYTIMDNDEVFISGDINPDEPVIAISLDGIEIGVHNFTLFANDTSGNTANDTAVVTVVPDDIVPIMIFAPDDIYYSQGDINIIRNWTASDDFMDYYTIDIATIIGDTITTEEVVNADWETENIEFDFAGLLSGTYDVTLTVYDIGGNSVQSTVRVVVTQAYLVTYLTWMAIGSVAIIALIAIIWFVRFR